MKILVSWLGRKALLYVFIVAAILFATLVLPRMTRALHDGRAGAPLTLAETKEAVEESRVGYTSTLAVRERDFRGFSRSKLEAS